MKKRIKFEVCSDGVEAVREAVAGGAARVELCQALSLDGLTPSAGAIGEAVRLCAGTPAVEVMVLIRPRDGGFVYTPAEKEEMLADIRQAARLGASGVVVGALTPGGEIDRDWTSRAAGLARSLGLSVTFHRAFDRLADPFEALDFLASEGVDRILTSGQAPSALEGAERLAELVRHARGRISIMPGAGVSAKNIERLYELTGAVEFHGSSRRPDAEGVLRTDRREVAEIVEKLKSFA